MSDGSFCHYCRKAECICEDASMKHVIEIKNDDERRQHQRRREDQVRTLERYQLFREAFRAYLQRGCFSADMRTAYAEEAFKMLDVIERIEREREQGKDEPK